MFPFNFTLIDLFSHSISAVESVQKAVKVCILDIDVQGVANVKKSDLNARYVFIAPPSMEQLEIRLRGRGTEKEEDIQIRLGNAAQEIAYGKTKGEFDLYLINDELKSSFQRLADTIQKWYPNLKRASDFGQSESQTTDFSSAESFTRQTPTASSTVPDSPIKAYRPEIHSAITPKTKSNYISDGNFSPLVDNLVPPPPLSPDDKPVCLAPPIKCIGIPACYSDDALGISIRIVDKFIQRTKPKLPYSSRRRNTDEPQRVLTKLTGVNWLGNFVGATHYGMNYKSPYVGECVGVVNQLLDAFDECNSENEALKKLKDDHQLRLRRSAAVNKLVAAYVHLVASWSSYNLVHVPLNSENSAAGTSSNAAKEFVGPPVSNQLTSWAMDTAEALVAHGCFDYSVSALPNFNLGGSSAAISAESITHAAAHTSPIQRLSDAVCRLDLSTEESELSALKFILTTGCRTTLVGNLSMLHGKDLLQLIRTAYHIYLKTGSEANKTTSRAALQQLVASVFQRMEIQDPMGTTATMNGGKLDSHVPQAAASKALAEDGPFDSPKSPKRFISANAGKGEVLQQFFNEHPEVQPNTSATSQIESTKPSVTENLDSKRSGNHSIPLDDMPSGSKAATFATPSHLDAFLVLRSLCKLSMRALPDSLNVSSSFSTHPEISNTDDDRTGHSSSVGSNPAMESKILALELLLYVLDHATPSAAMFSTPSFSFAIRNYLCVSLLKNCTSSNTRIVALSLRLFIPIIRHFREGLKTEIEAFVTNVFFVILDSPNSTVEHKSLVVTLFQEICSCEDTLAEIFLNYDCDLSAVDLFHRIVTALSRVASKVGGETDFSDRGVFSSGNPQSAAMRQALRELKLSAMRALRQVLASLYESVRVEGLDARLNCTSTDDSITAYSGDGASVYSNNHSLSSYDALGESAQHSEGTIPVSGPPLSKGSAIVKIYDSKKKMREQEVEILIRFNQKPAAGIKYAGECGFIDASNPVEVAKFLMASKDKLDKTQIGDYLGREPEFQGGFGVRVLHAYVDMLDFNEMSFDDAIRYFLSGFRLPGEAQKVSAVKLANSLTLLRNILIRYSQLDVVYRSTESWRSLLNVFASKILTSFLQPTQLSFWVFL